MKVFYILDNFPNISETFILREILALKKSGIDIKIYSLKKPADETVHPAAIPLLDDVVYFSDISFFRKFFASLSTFFTHPTLVVKLDFSLFFDMLLSPRFMYHRLRGAINAMAIAKTADSKPEHIHAHFAYVTTDSARILAKLFSCKWSVSVHAWDLFTQSPKLLTKRLETADKIFTCTKHGIQYLEKCVSNIKGKTILMYHGLNTSEFENIGQSEYIISVGRLKEKKGFGVLIQAANILATQGIKPRFIIIGNGPLKKKLEADINKYQLKNIEFTGNLPFNKVKEIMINASMLVQASIVTANGDHDGIPNVLLEAMAFAKPVISANVGGISELIEDEKNGFIIHPDDPESLAEKIKELIEDNIKSSKIGAQGRKYVKKHFEIMKNIKPILNYLKRAKGSINTNLSQ